MIVRIGSFAAAGIDAYPVEIEVDASRGFSKLHIVGLADTAIRESKERVKTAIKNSGFKWPKGRITINLAPPDIRKEGTSFDLAIALGIIAASKQMPVEHLQNYSIAGSLSLDGSLRPTRGILAISLAAARTPVRNLLIPRHNAKEAAIVAGISVWPVKSIREAVHLLQDPEHIQPFKMPAEDIFCSTKCYPVDFSEVKGQYFAKRALEIAVSGGHNVLMIGPPGSGKTMLAQCIPTIMPDLTLPESLEVTRIHSIAGLREGTDGVVNTRPFRNPHHNTSSAALIGGGAQLRPGEISLAHHGVLFLDELPEFNRDCLEALRQPLEEGNVRISRARFSSLVPASFMLVAAMNPCPCGYYTDKRRSCRCTPGRIESYLKKVSGPLLDRIDIHVELPAVVYRDLTDTRAGESSYQIRQRVEKVRTVQKERLQQHGIFVNARMRMKQLRACCNLNASSHNLLKAAMQELELSARAYIKILKVSRTIADMGESEHIRPEHIAEAVQYRSLDRGIFMP